MRQVALLTILTIILAACGTPATPVPNSATLTAEGEEHAEDQEETHSEPTEVVLVPTDTPAPTDTPVPPTPTEVPPTEAPTEAPAEEAVDQTTRLIQTFGDATNGERIFMETYNTAQGGWACMTCHDSFSDSQLVGPGLLTVGTRAADRVEGESAELYIYNSIVNPNDYIVEGFPENLMPQSYSEVLSDQEVYDLVAYLISLSQ